MAYLNTQLSKQELGVVAENIPIENELAESNITAPTDFVENSNLKIARKLIDEKSRLINVLCQFPVTALWLLNEYEQKSYATESDDEAASASELTTTLINIKKYFHCLSGKTLLDATYIADKKNLYTALQSFPFSFNDLTKLVDTIVYAHKFRGLCYQPTHSLDKNSDLILKRLEGLSRRSTNKSSKWSQILLAYDGQFLFLSSSDMHKYFSEVVISEHHWLKLRQQLATANSRLVLFIANQYKGCFLNFDDLVQEGQIGLLKAVDRFNYRLGFQFSTYAGYWIRQSISRSLSRCERVVRVPCGQVANINKVFRTKDQLTTKQGKEPSIKELAECAKLSNDEINSILSISQTAMSLEGFEDDEENSFAPIDFLEQQVFTPSFMTIAKSDLEDLITKAIKVLNPREAKVICCHFGVNSDNEMTLQEIGAELNLTRERVRQIQVMALDKIKRSFGEQLISFL
ncbi:RNA polymerase sigma factor RpoD/SigA [Methylobacter sp. S3L5C]|uniref:sigma-70 family RNA polymerase sigma factor n=1 Tax=Methylobacter sp. S3L5C TaxID=2839024 RepID=UPI001FADE783|nr:RNA polymerase sigma factor RpoD/SigA [Methylobacter sp. S3L5C]UOA08737.1 RNA polymerase sigma factor RpoD/SigA [Methylobacter sp. S3L5C]